MQEFLEEVGNMAMRMGLKQQLLEVKKDSFGL